MSDGKVCLLFEESDEGDRMGDGRYEPSIYEMIDSFEKHDDGRISRHFHDELRDFGLEMEEKHDGYLVCMDGISSHDLMEKLSEAIDSTVHAEGHGRAMNDAIREALSFENKED